MAGAAVKKTLTIQDRRGDGSFLSVCFYPANNEIFIEAFHPNMASGTAFLPVHVFRGALLAVLDENVWMVAFGSKRGEWRPELKMAKEPHGGTIDFRLTLNDSKGIKRPENYSLSFGRKEVELLLHMLSELAEVMP